MKKHDWYVMQIMTGKELKLARVINQRMDSTVLDKCFVPMAKRLKQYKGSWHEHEYVLFPGYLFVITKDINEFNQKLKAIPEFTKLLGNDGKGILPLIKQDIDLIRRFINDDCLMEMSTGYIVNDRVKISSGPLMGYEGNIKKVDRHKRVCFIEVNFCNQITLMKVGLEVIHKIEE